MTAGDLVVTSARLVGLILLADLAGGLFHWAEDTWGDVDTPVWGPLFVRPNAEHHDRPTLILTTPWMRSGRLVIGAALAVLAAAWVLGVLTWEVGVFVLLTAFNDEAHLLEHMPTARLPKIVILLRRLHVLQSARQHWQHHKAPHTSAYCVLTPWLNPVLDRTRFWRGLEWLLAPLLGVPRGRDHARGAG